MKPTLTIGMATYDDFWGLWPTIQAIRINDADLMDRVKFVVVDNNPTGEHAKHGLRLASGAGATYIAMPEPTGTCPPRQRVFEVAQTDWVLCIDSHILLFPGALKALFKHIDANPESDDLLAGPLLLDSLRKSYTHYKDVWRSNMWGTWGSDPRGDVPGGEPFEIEAHGFGLFACRKVTWDKIGGFHPAFRGFGGGEWYIHEKIRRNGGKCLCIPDLKWAHRFGRPEGIPYRDPMWNVVRNRVIGHAELGIPLDRIKAEFVQPGKLSEDLWKLMTANPSNPPEKPPRGIGILLPKKDASGKPIGKPVTIDNRPKRASGFGGRRPDGLVSKAEAKGTPPARLEQLPCAHRIEPLRIQPCDLCGGDKGTPQQVYSCKLHGECTLNRKIRAIRGCAGCPDRLEAPALHSIAPDVPAVLQ